MKRSELDAESLTARLRQVGVAQLGENEASEAFASHVTSDLVLPFSEGMLTVRLLRG